MVIDLIAVGKTDSEHVAALTDMYAGRINRYVKFNLVTVPDVRRGVKLPQSDQMRDEGERLLKLLDPGDFVVCLDESGDQLSSANFATWVGKRLSASTRRLCFIIGGPYGFSPEMRRRADFMLSLSAMTFSHQIVRAIFAEQLYRAFSILNNEPYHHA